MLRPGKRGGWEAVGHHRAGGCYRPVEVLLHQVGVHVAELHFQKLHQGQNGLGRGVGSASGSSSLPCPDSEEQTGPEAFFRALPLGHLRELTPARSQLQPHWPPTRAVPPRGPGPCCSLPWKSSWLLFLLPGSAVILKESFL